MDVSNEKMTEKLNEFETFYSSLPQDNSKLYLYRVLNGTTRYIAKFTALPEIDEIAETFGGGHYQLALKFKDIDCTWKTKTQTIHIDNAVNTPSNSLIQPVNQLDNSILIIEKMLNALSPLLKPAVSSNNLEAQNEVVNKMMMSNFQAQQKLFNNFIKVNEQQVYTEDDEQPEQQEVPAWLSTIGELVEEYLPDLLGDGVASKLLVGMIHKNKQFKEIKEDESKSQVLIEYMVRQIGQEKTQAVLDKLFVK